jgi:hypothetical protein
VGGGGGEGVAVGGAVVGGDVGTVDVGVEDGDGLGAGHVSETGSQISKVSGTGMFGLDPSALMVSKIPNE